MNKFWVVALETFKKNVKSGSFVMMILAPFLLIGISLGGGYIGSKFESVDTLAVVSDNPAVREQFVAQAKNDFDLDKNIADEKAAEAALEKEEIDGFLSITLTGSSVTGNYIGNSSLPLTDKQLVLSYLTQIQMALTSQDLNLSGDDIGRLMSQADFSEREVEFVDGVMKDKESNRFVNTIVGFFVLMAIYMIVILYSSITAQEVASEKGTRIMEVILSSTTAAKHYYGKIMGIFLVILTQVFVYLIAGLIAYLFVQNMDFVQSFLKEVSLKELLQSVLGYNLLYLLLGVVIYTILSAFSGSLVSKAEDSAKAVTPVTYLILIAFFPSMMLGMSNPQHIVLKVMSYVPFLSSFAMPMRLGDGSVSNLSVLISLAILVVAIVILLRVSAKLYKATVLVYSDKGMWKTFIEGLKFSK